MMLPRPRSVSTLALIGVVLAAIWLVLLPQLAESDLVESRLQLMNEHQIDASALFYTDVDSTND